MATQKSKKSQVIAGMALYPAINRTVAKCKTDGKNLEDREYATRLLATKKDLKRVKSDYPNCTLGAPKEYTAKQFKEAFKIDPPKHYESGEDEYYVANFTAFASYKPKDGKEAEAKTAPLLLGVKKVNEAEGRYQDSEGNIFDQSVMLASGTEGVLKFNVRALTGQNEGRVKLDLGKFQIKKLVEYIPVEADDEFEVEEADEGTDDDEFEMEDDSSTSSSETETEVDDWND